MIITATIKLRMLARDERIEEGDYHSLNGNGSFYPVMNKESVGQTPNNFNKNREFYRPQGPVIHINS